MLHHIRQHRREGVVKVVLTLTAGSGPGQARMYSAEECEALHDSTNTQVAAALRVLDAAAGQRTKPAHAHAPPNVSSGHERYEAAAQQPGSGHDDLMVDLCDDSAEPSDEEESDLSDNADDSADFLQPATARAGSTAEPALDAEAIELSDDEDEIEEIADDDVVILATQEDINSARQRMSSLTDAAMRPLQPGDERLDVTEVALKYAFHLESFRGDQKVREPILQQVHITELKTAMQRP